MKSPILAALSDPKAVDLLAAWGAPYCWGGGNPATPWLQFGAGLDCSGFAQVALVRLGLLSASKPDRTSAALASACVKVSAEQDQRLGDLAFYGRGSITHVMVVITPGVVIGAHGGGSQTTGNDPRAHVGIEPLLYRTDLAFVGRLQGV
jgi:cell wall-associated NlpC family hydrolase